MMARCFDSRWRVLAALAALVVLSFGVHAQEFRQPIRLIVPFAPGGATDVLARLLAPRLGSSLGQSVIVENRPGASGQIAVQFVQNARPDGSTFLIAADHSMVVVPLMAATPPYDAMQDFVSLGMIVKFQWAFQASTGTGVKSIAEFLNYAKQDPQKANYGVAALGGMPQMIGVELGKKAGIPLVTVPYNGSAPLSAALMAQQVSGGVSGVPDVVEHYRAGKILVLAVSGDRRSSMMPDVPTLAEAGVPGLSVTNWQGMFAPKGLPEAMQRRFNAALNDALKDPEVQQRIKAMALDLFPTTLDEARAEVKASSDFWHKVANTPGSGMKP